MPGSAPSDVVGGPVWMSPMVIARSPDIAICLAGVSAYPLGFHIRLSIRRRTIGRNNVTRLMALEELLTPGDGLTIQVNAAGPIFAPREYEHPSSKIAPIIEFRSTSARADIDLWIDTVPRQGTIEIRCTWPAEGITEGACSFDSASLRDAQTRAIQLWTTD
jgi:hypothetical protein